MRFRCLSYFLFLMLNFSSGYTAWTPPEQFSTSGVAGSVSLAAGGNESALLAYLESGGSNGLFASNYSNGVWNTSQLETAIDFIPKVAMDETGTGFLLWVDSIFGPFTGTFRATYFDGTSFQPATNFETITFFDNDAIAMDGTGRAIAAWIGGPGAFIQNVSVSLFSAGTWTPYQSLGAASQMVAVAYSQNGTAVTLWESPTNDVVARIFDGSIWQPAVILGTTIPTFSLNRSNIAVKMDVNGNALAVWMDPAGDVISSYFNGSWQPSVTISPSNGNINNISLGMSNSGTAVAVWQDASQNGVSAAFNGSSWQPTQIFGTSLNGVSLNPPSVSVKAAGDALVVYVKSDLSINSASLPLGSVWQNQQIVTTTTNPSVDTETAVSSDGTYFAAWSDGNVFASTLFNPVVAPPTSIAGRVAENKFASQTDRIHIISFTASLSPDVVAYYIRRNGRLIAVIPTTSPYIYLDHNRCKRCETYTVTAVDADGVESSPVSVSLR